MKTYSKISILAIIAAFQLFFVSTLIASEISGSKFNEYLQNDQPDSAIYFVDNMIRKVRVNNDTAHLLQYQNALCTYLVENCYYNSAVRPLKEYVRAAEEYHASERIAESYRLTGVFFDALNVNKRITLEYLNKSQSIFRANRDYLGEAYVIIDIAHVYEQQGKIDEAIDLYKSGIKLCEEWALYKPLFQINRQLAEIYRHEFLDFNTGLAYYNKCLQMATYQKDTSYIADAYIELGCIHSQYGLLDSASVFYKKAEVYINELADESILSFFNWHMAELMERQGNFQLALAYLSQVKSNSVYGFKNNIPEPFLNSALLEDKLGNYKNASRFYKKYIRLQDSLDIIKQAKEFAKLELKFELENIENENLMNLERSEVALDKQRDMIKFLVVLSLLLIVIVYLLYRNYKTKQKTAISLHEADKAKLRFFTNISHEIRTPLTLMTSPLERVKTELKGSSVEELSDVMLRNSKKLKGLINQLLDISKIDDNNLTLNKSYVDFNEIFLSTANMFESLAKEKEIAYQIESYDEPVFFQFDKERIAHILSNLLSNAFKFTNSGGIVKASLKMHNQQLSVTIKDSGIGIEESELKNIFNRFYQSPKTNHEQYSGSGIGLNIVKEYVELHEGTISATSRLNEGSCFIVSLPLIAYNDSYEVLDKVQNGGNSDFVQVENNKLNSNEGNILIVEDNHELRKYIAGIFRNSYHVIEAKNGKEAKELVDKNEPDIILSDIMMPFCNGYELTKYLKINIETSHIPVILLTAKNQQCEKLEGYNSGADDYLTKPFHESELLIKVRNILSTRNKYKKKFRNHININLSELQASSLDEKLLLKLFGIVELNISDADFTVEQFISEAGMSQRNLHRKLKALTDMNASQFIRSIRLKRAAQLLSKNTGSISEIAYQTGFENLSYFTKSFKAYFNQLPSEFIRKQDYVSF